MGFDLWCGQQAPAGTPGLLRARAASEVGPVEPPAACTRGCGWEPADLRLWDAWTRARTP